MPPDRESEQPGVVDLLAAKEKKAERKRTASAEEKNVTVRIVDNIATLVEVLLRNPLVSWKPMHSKFYIKRDATGNKIIFEETEGEVVRMVSETAVFDALVRYMKSHAFHEKGIEKIMPPHINHVIKLWSARAEELGDIPYVRQKSTPGKCFRRLDFDLTDDPFYEKCPLFMEMMQRTNNSDALQAWIGSLFDPKSYMQQYVWLYGDGRNGKSSLGRLLSRIFGDAALWAQPPGMNDRFWTINLVGRRLVVFGDCNNASFVTTGLFKGLTGGDMVQAEIKNGPTVNVNMHAKYLFFSNKRPDIDSGTADQRRVIFCHMGPVAAEEADYEERLWREAPWILGRCWAEYRRAAGPGRPIKTNGAAAELAAENESHFLEIFMENFVKTGLQSDIVYPIHFQKPMQDAGLRNPRDQRRFYEYIERVMDIRRVKIGERPGYRGVTRRPFY